MTFKEFKTNIRKKIGWIGIGEFSDDPLASNSVESWNTFFNNKRFLKNYIEPKRLSFYSELVCKINMNLELKNSKSLIDMGCGTGHLLSEIQKHNPHLKLTGSDFSEQAIVVAKKTLPNAIFLSCDLYNISEDLVGKYDIVICTEVLEHLLYPEKAIANLMKLFSKGKGYLILSVPNGRRDTYEGHINFWSPESWRVFIEYNCPKNEVEYSLIDNKMTNLAIIKLL
ncbi:MAG: class I SAM-dependent methyltransferase [Bacteroidetes bacterium]|nr:class I SAM-dependent methyltransferase [Bacteroidota bacterium]